MPRMEGTTLHAILAPGKRSEAQRAPKPPAAPAATPKPPAAQQAPVNTQVTAQS
jgi:translation initiation factor IF-3